MDKEGHGYQRAEQQAVVVPHQHGDCGRDGAARGASRGGDEHRAGDGAAGKAARRPAVTPRKPSAASGRGDCVIDCRIVPGRQGTG